MNSEKAEQTMAWDVNARRLRTFLELLRDDVGKRPGQGPTALEEIGVPSNLDTLHWLSAEEEIPLLRRLCDEYDAWHLLYLAGRRCVTTMLLYVLPHNPALRTVPDVVASIPAFITHFLTAPITRIAEREDHIFEFEIFYTGGREANAVDLIFILGLLSGVFDFIQVPGAGTLAREIGFPREEYPESELKNIMDVKWDARRTLLYVFAPRQDVNQKQRAHEMVSLRHHRQNARELFVRQVLNRSAQLFQDKRELTTAVEYLNMANDQLERKIRESAKEMQVARNIQRGFFPKQIPDWYGLRFYAFNQPLAGVSGDLYDFFPLPDDQLAVLVADVCGHGVPAALISAIAKLSFINHSSDKPSWVFGNVNLDILKFVKMEGYLTAFYMTVDAQYKIQYSLAGMPAPILLRARTGEATRLPGSGTLLGMFPNAADYFEDQALELETGDTLFIYTDGLTEAVNRDEEQFGSVGLLSAIRETVGMDPEEATEHVLARQREFCIGQDTMDDLTMLTVQFNPKYNQFKEHYGRARNLYRSKDVAAAERELRAAIDIAPNHTDSLYTLSRLMANGKRYDEAEAMLEHLVELRPFHAPGHALLARCRYATRRHALAEADLRRALALEERPVWVYQLVVTLCKLEKIPEAENHLERLREMEGESERVKKLEALLQSARPD